MSRKTSLHSYTAVVLSSPQHLTALGNPAEPFLRNLDDGASPLFFLASVNPKAWNPYVVIVKYSGRAIGALYAKERKHAGVPLGIFYADATLNPMVIADEGHRQQVLEVAIRALWGRPGVRSLRVLVAPGGIEETVLKRSLGSEDIESAHSMVENHCVLHLPSTYDLFLQVLGSKTRRNFRYYRRRFEAVNGDYVEDLSLDDFKKIAVNLLAKNVVGAGKSGVARALRMLSEVKEPILVGLRRPDGDWVSILGGWYQGDRAIVFCQMNNEIDYPDDSLSIILRSYLIESLIRTGTSEVLFWAGIGPPLLRHCQFLPTKVLYFDASSFGWRATRSLISRLDWILPARFRSLSAWITPAREWAE